MIIHPPTMWQHVPVGAVVLIGGVPRRVIANGPMFPSRPDDWRVILVEGCAMPATLGLHTVSMVTLDDADAMATLAAAGLHPEVINVSVEGAP